MSRNEHASEGEPNGERTERDEPPPIALEKLAVANRLGEIGIDGARERFEGVKGFEGSVEAGRARTGFVDWSNLYCTFGLEERMACKVRLPGGPYGCALVVFSEPSANAVAETMLSAMDEDPSEASQELVRSALQEVGAMAVNGFFDAWADTFELRIDVGTPTFDCGTEQDVIRRVLQGKYDLGVYLAATLDVPAHGVGADVYVFPETGTFVEILNRLTIDRVTT